jgi:hypothetical protein
MRCSGCAKKIETKTSRLPKSWKRKDEQTYCPVCWRERYVLRAVAMPVASPLDCSWEELNKLLREAWASTTQCSNWAMTEMYTRDTRRTDDQAKMPPMARQYLYPDARKRFPALTPQSVASLEQAIQNKYRALRWKLIWTCQVSLPAHRYPTPFPVHNQSWTVSIENQCPVVSLRIGEGRYRLRLRGGPQFRRQLADVKDMIQGRAVRGECAIYQRGQATMVKMVGWMPRATTERGNRENTTLRVRTEKDSLLIAINTQDERIWSYNADHVRRWIAQHRRQLQRWSEDAKYEQRPVPSFTARRTAAVTKQRDRMRSAVQEIAAQLGGYAARRKFARVEYDDTERGYSEQFPWFILRDRIRTVLDTLGIAFEVTGPPDDEDAGVSAEKGVAPEVSG